jgi:hemoglobin
MSPAPTAPDTTAALTPDADRIALLVHGFYADVRNDPLLGPVFEKALHGRWDAHLQRLVDFWSTVALGTRSFKGDVFGKHMALEGVTPAHFAAWVGLWQHHTSRLFAPEVAHDLQVAAHGIARNLFRGYFGSDPAFVPPRVEHGGHPRH